MLCLALPFLGTYAWLNGRIEAAKAMAAVRIKKAIPREDQLLWKFSLADTKSKLEWEHSREFEYKGEMYDVIRSEQRGDTMWYWCYWDREETKLKNKLNVIVLNLMGPGTQCRNDGVQIHHFFKSLFNPPQGYSSIVASMVLQRHCITPYFFSLILHATGPPAPPPWIC